MVLVGSGIAAFVGARRRRGAARVICARFVNELGVSDGELAEPATSLLKSGVMLYYLLATLYVLACLMLLLVVLLQQGKGGDMASAFGGGGSQTAFGARAGATVLTRATSVLGVVFMLGAIVLGIIGRQGPGSIMSGVAGPPPVAAPAPVTPPPATTPAPSTPTGQPPAAPTFGGQAPAAPTVGQPPAGTQPEKK
jgi:preprotein translocase subunit SecG